MNRAALSGFAVDLGGTKTAAARIEAGEIVARLQTPTQGAAPPKAHLAAMADLLNRLGWQPGPPLAVAVAGRIGTEGQWSAVNPGTLAQVAGFDLAGALTERFGGALAVNDAAAATWAEAHLGAGRGLDRLAYVTVSTGVGGGLMLGGRLLSSPEGLAGHLGFMSARAMGGHMATACESGRGVTVESQASGRAIARLAKAAGYGDYDARRVLEAAQTGAVWADRIIDHSAATIARLAGDLRAALGIEAVILGGGLGLGPGYLPRVAAHLAAEPALFRPALLPAALGADSALYGALGLMAASPSSPLA